MDFGPGPGLWEKHVSPISATQPRRGDLESARSGDESAFERLVETHRRGLLAHCYRMLGSAQDAEDALQETLLRAWRGLPAFEGRSSLRSWLYRIATNVSLRTIERRPKRVLPVDYGPPGDPHDRPTEPVLEPIWLEPYPDELVDDGQESPEERFAQRESVELAFVAALQYLPARQRAVLLLRDVLGYAPAEIAPMLDMSSPAVYSALQRAHQAVDERLPGPSQQATLRSIGEEGVSELARRYVDAWEEADIDKLVELLTDDATLVMPPRRDWYRGREEVGAFLAAAALSRPRRFLRVPVGAGAQLAFGVYERDPSGGPAQAHALELLTLDRGARVAGITAFHRPQLFARFGLPAER